MAQATKVGIIACGGEEIAAGSISRLASRRVLEALRPRTTVTLCLPLFLAGEEQERRFARQHPTITVDGCEKRCAQRGTEQYSGHVAASLVVSEILDQRLTGCHRSIRDFDKTDEEAVWIVAERIAAEVDALSTTSAAEPTSEPSAAASCGCACGSAPPEGSVIIGGKPVAINGLPLIFAQLYRENLRPGPGCAERVFEVVRIYHEVAPCDNEMHRAALAEAYAAYCRQRG